MSGVNTINAYGVLQFANLNSQINVLDIDNNNCKLMVTDQTFSGLLTFIVKYGDNGWGSLLWTKSIVDSIINLLIDNVDDPVLWIMGEYTSDDYGKIMQGNLLPEGVQLNIPLPPKLGTASLILRQTDTQNIILPVEQGLGHMIGVRIAVFPRSREPIHLYNKWLTSIPSHSDNCVEALLISDTNMPNGAVGWVSPFGVEDRNHCLISKEGLDPAIIGCRLANGFC
ncbi:MAG: hypothetical protein ABFD64_02540 [Armatimonadota bacterium]